MLASVAPIAALRAPRAGAAGRPCRASAANARVSVPAGRTMPGLGSTVVRTRAARRARPARAAAAGEDDAAAPKPFSWDTPATPAAEGAPAAPAPQPVAAPVAPAPAPVAVAPAAKPAKGPSKPRLPSLDSLRFFLIAYIAVGHFVGFATSNTFLLKLMTQVNVWVGAFFVLSGYVAGYTATEPGKYEANPRVKPAGAYIAARVMGYYPLYALVQTLFGAMFIFADNAYNGPLATAAHGLMGATLTQAWFPAHAEIWNAPTWFLSALTFAMAVLPHALPAIAAMRKAALQRLLAALTAFSLLGKLAYSYDLGAWTLLEGFMAPRLHPNLLLWNVTRFHPFYAAVEVLIGVAAVRLVMTERVDGDGKALTTPPPAPGSALLPLAGLLAVTVARAAGWLQLNDPLTRGLLFIPLFTLLIMRLHRHTAASATGTPGGVAGVLAHPVLTYLGTISFPIFVVHGALGQVFYKKIIATKLWGAVMPHSFFPLYCLIVLAAAAALQHLFLVRLHGSACAFACQLTRALPAAPRRRTRRCRS
jgi:peptidoglycan/LPS O-acetylase OafA/YrhL